MDEPFGPRPYGPSAFLVAFEELCNLVPAAIIIYLAPFYLYRAITATRCIRQSALLWLKLGVVAALAAVQINVTFRWWDACLSAPALARTAALAQYASMPSLGLIVWVEHLYSPSSHPFLSVFLATTLLVDVAAFPTYFYRGGLGYSEEPHRAFLALKFSLFVLEQVSKRQLVCLDNSPAELGDADARSRFWRMPIAKWAMSSFLFGFQVQIEKEHASDIDRELVAEDLYKRFLPQWEKVDKSYRFALLKTCFYTVPEIYLSTVLPRLLRSFFLLCQPFLVRDVMIALSVPQLPSDVKRKLIITTALIYFGIAGSSAWYTHARGRLLAAVRLTLEAAAYNKCLKLNVSTWDPVTLSTIMNNDLSSLGQFFSATCNDWAVLLEAIFCMACLTSLWGPFSILAIVPAILAGANVVYTKQRANAAQRDWNRRVEDHASITSNILAQMTDVKMLGLGAFLSRHMQRYQEDEIRASIAIRAAECCVHAGGAFIESVTPSVAVGIALFAADRAQPLSVTDFSTTVILGLMLGNTLNFPVRAIWARLQGSDSLERVQEFLLQGEVEDKRIFAPDQLHRVSNNAAVTALQRRNRRDSTFSRFVVQFVNASVTLDATRPILHDISISIRRKKITMLFAATGRGKSTFLKTIIGQVQLSGGSLFISTTSIAYCGQKPWIMNLTIRDNIVAKSPFDAAWLRLVIYICALDIDLARLSEGDLTMAGSDGCNLSGGQRHRISLARALYAKKEIIIVDDIFTSLDMETSSAIRIRLFGESQVLRSNNITLIMSTTMQHLVDADQVFEITSQGIVRERSFASREASPSYLPRRLGGPDHGAAGESAALEETNEAPPLQPPRLGIRFYHVPDRKYGDWSLYAFFLQPTGATVLIVWFGTVCTAALVERLHEVFVCFWMENAPDNRAYFLTYAVFCLANAVFNHFAVVSYFYLLHHRTSRALHSKVAETVCRATLDYLTSTDTYFLLNKFCQDVYITTELLSELLVPLSWSILSMCIHLVSFSWPSSSMMLPAFLICFILAVRFFYNRATHQLAALHKNAGSGLSKLLAETGTGVEYICAFGWQAAFLKHFYTEMEELYQMRHHKGTMFQWCKAMFDKANAVIAVTVVVLALNSEKPVSHGALSFALYGVLYFADNMSSFIQVWVDSDGVLNGAHRVRTFVNSTPQEKDQVPFEPVPWEWARQGKLELNSVTAHYKPYDRAPHLALDRVSITINPGQIVGIAGRTGSGKTSLFLAVLNLLEFAGSISIDDREIRTLPRDVLRSRITTMTQSGLMLKGSVRFNIDLLDPSMRPKEFRLTDEMLVGILRRVGLWDHIEEHGGLDAQIVAMRFSHGQKQLFQLARAILHKQMMRTKIILIDEGDPNPEIEGRIRQVIREVFAGCTILMVSHQISVFHEADMILTVDNGRARLYEHDRQRGHWFPNPQNP